MRDKCINIAIFVVANICGFILSLLPDKAFYWQVKILALIFRCFDRRRKKDCIHNLDFAYDGAFDNEAKKRILYRCYENFAFVLLNALRLLFMDKNKYLSKFRVHNNNIVDEAIKKGNILFVTAHYGDWEATSRWTASHYRNINLSVVGRFTQFSSVNSLMERSRQTFGSSFLDKKGVSKHLIKLLNKPNNAIGIVIDQNIAPNEGIYVKFFGKDVTHTTIASVLSRKYNLPIIFCWTRLAEDYSTYDIYFETLTEPIISGDSKDDIVNLTQIQADFTEKIVRESPAEWFWFHKRFKAKYNEIYTYD